MQKSNTLLKGMYFVLLANIINMFFNIVTNLILPKYLSIDSYAAVKTYQLYISYIGALHLGFIDGMYLKYGGTKLSEIDKKGLSTNLDTLRVFMFVMATLSTVVSILIKNKVLLFFSLAIVPLNMANYFTSLYQATGEFNRYGKIINATAILNCLINLFLIFILKTDNYSYFLSSYIIINIIIWIILEKSFIDTNNFKVSVTNFSINEIIMNCRMGILLMLGNLSSFILTGLDRWFVKFFMDNLQFALYSFAVSMETFLNVAMNPVTVTLYNYFCNHKSKEEVTKVRNFVIMFSTVIIAAAFPAKFVLEKFLTKYIKSTIVMFILFGTQIFSMINKGIYANLYKANRRQKQYFIKLIIVIISAALFNYVLFMMFNKKEAFAVGTLLSAVLWFVLNKKDFKEIDCGLNVYLYIGINIAIFLYCGIKLNSILGLIIYLACMIVNMFFFMRTEFLFIIHYGRKRLKELIKM